MYSLIRRNTYLNEREYEFLTVGSLLHEVEVQGRCYKRFFNHRYTYQLNTVKEIAGNPAASKTFFVILTVYGRTGLVDDLDAPAPSEVRTDILIRDEDGVLEFHGMEVSKMLAEKIRHARTLVARIAGRKYKVTLAVCPSQAIPVCKAECQTFFPSMLTQWEASMLGMCSQVLPTSLCLRRSLGILSGYMASPDGFGD